MAGAVTADAENDGLLPSSSALIERLRAHPDFAPHPDFPLEGDHWKMSAGPNSLTNEAADMLERYMQVCAAAYQLAGMVGAPLRFLDALGDAANGEIGERTDPDKLLPVDLTECDAFEMAVCLAFGTREASPSAVEQAIPKSEQPVALGGQHALPPLSLAPSFGDPETLFNSRDWLQKAIEAKGAKVDGKGVGCGQADLDFELEGCTFNVSIKPR